MFRSLKEDITESQTDIRIQKSDLFEIPLSLNTLQIDNKLIIYNNENIWFTADKNGKTLYAIYALSEGEELPETINGPTIFLTVK